MANVGSQVWDRVEQTKKPQAKMIQWVSLKEQTRHHMQSLL